MALTESTMTSLGTPAPSFSLPDVITGTTIQLSDFASKTGLLVMFICRHCPYVKRAERQLAALGRDYSKRDLGIVAICSNDAESYSEDSPAGLKQQAEEQHFTFPYLYDETQEIARAYGAVCTPDFFLYDANRTLVYRGQLDGSRPGNGVPSDGRDLRNAIECVLDGRPVPSEQKASIGCGIKWKE